MLRLRPGSWPIRWRLTALNVGALAVTLFALSTVFLLVLDNALIRLTADHLREQARTALQPGPPQRLPPPRERGRLGPPERAGPGPADLSAGLARAGDPLVRRLSGPDVGVSVFDPTGALVATSDALDDVEPWPDPSPGQLRAVLAGAEQSDVVAQETRRTLVLLLPLRTSDGRIVGVLELASSLQFVDSLEAGLRTALLIGAAIALFVAGALSLRVTRAALRPLERVIQAARDIGAGHLDVRLRLTRRDEIGELAEAFDSMLDRLAAVLTAQRRFVADAAHELRTPLTALGGMVEMLQMGADRGDRATVRRMLGTMDREIDRLGRLVADLLTLSRLDAEQPPPPTPVPLEQIVAEVAGQTRLMTKGQDVEVKIGDSPTVLGNADRLKQVLINLAANAVAFTPPDGRIEFRLDRANGHARLVVADTGSGIPPEVLPRVMDRFVRGDPSRSRATGGSGLGLAIAREIVESHGGTLALESEPGHGTSAIVELPLADAPAGDPQPPPSPASSRSLSSRSS